MEEVKQIKIDEIGAFPTQADIYGEAIIDAEFLASVEEFGILTPVIICNSADILDEYEAEYTLISGHRRLAAAQQAGQELIPAIIRNYGEDIEENRNLSELEFLTCNMQREKSERTRLREFLAYKQKLSQFTKTNVSKRTWDNSIFENKSIFRILNMLNLDEDLSSKALNSTEILKEITGFNKYEQDSLKILYDGDWLDRQLFKLRDLGLSLAAEEEMIALREHTAEQYDLGEISLNSAVSAVKKLFSDVTAKLTKKTQPKPAKSERPTKVAVATPRNYPPAVPAVHQSEELRLKFDLSLFQEVGEDFQARTEARTEIPFSQDGIMLGASGEAEGLLIVVEGRKKFIAIDDVLHLFREVLK